MDEPGLTLPQALVRELNKPIREASETLDAFMAATLDRATEEGLLPKS